MNYFDLLPYFLGINNNERYLAEQQYQNMISSNSKQLLYEMLIVLQDNNSEIKYHTITAVLLRGIIIKDSEIFNQFNVEEFSQFRSQLLSLTINETIPHVQRQLAHVVAALAHKQSWPELLNSLPEMSQSSNFRMKQLCCFLIDKLAEYIGPFLLENIEVVWKILSSVLEENIKNKEELVTSVSAGSAMISLLHEIPNQEFYFQQYPYLRKSLYSISQLLLLSLESQNGDVMIDICEGLERLVRVKPAFFQDCYQTIFEVTQSVCLDEDANDSLKCNLLEISTELITNPISSIFSSNETTRFTIMKLCTQVLTQINITEDGTDLNSSYNYTWTSSSDEEFGDEDGSENLSIGVASYCLQKLYHTYPIEESLASLQLVSNLLSESSTNYIRTALVITSILFDILQVEMQRFLPQIFPTLLNYSQHSVPRIRICTFSCIQSIILSSVAALNSNTENNHHNEDDNEDENENEQNESKSTSQFFKDYSSSYLSVSINSLSENCNYPRVIYAILGSLRSFCDPQNCPKSVLVNVSENLLTILWSILETPNYPFVVLSEVVSLSGNISLLSHKRVLISCYPSYINFFKEMMVKTFDDQDNQNPIDISTFKGKCLEAAALFGRAIGMEVFESDAQLMMQWICSAHQAGLDFSDPLASYLVQTGARLAGLYGAEFQPYLELLIPPLLQHIVEELKVDILTEEQAETEQGYGTEEYKTYKRGVGNVRIIHSSYLVKEREMSCRALYQYILDIPDVIYLYAPNITEAATTIASLFMTEEMCLVIGTTLSDSLKIFLRYTPSSPETITTANKMIQQSVNALLGLLNYCHQSQSGNEKEQTQVIQIIIDSLRELLKVASEGKKGLPQYQDINIPQELIIEIMRFLVNESSRWVERNYRTIDKTPGQNIEEDLWYAISDSFGWSLKVSSTSDTGLFFSEEILPFLLGLLQESSDAIPLLSLSISVLIDALDVLPITSLRLPPSISETFESYPKFLITILLQNVSKEELKDDCLYGFGVCAQNDNPSFLPFISQCLELLTPYLDKPNEEENDDSFLVTRDIALSSLIKIAMFSNDYSERFQLLIRSLSYFPLHNNILVARDSHQLLVSIFFRNSAFVRSNGNILNIFTQLFIQIISYHNNLYSYLLNNNVSYGGFFEDYSDKILCYEVTIDDIENYISSNKSKLNISSEIVKIMKKRNKYLNKIK